MVSGVPHFISNVRSHVTIMLRNRPTAEALSSLDFIETNYIEDDCSDGRLKASTALSLPRQLMCDTYLTMAQWRPKNSTPKPIPKQCPASLPPLRPGIKRCVYIGSFYPTIAPPNRWICLCTLTASNRYGLAMSDKQFNVCSLNALFVVGHLPGLDIPHLGGLVQYAKGNIDGAPIFSPVGGTNHISSESVSEAILGALLRGIG